MTLDQFTITAIELSHEQAVQLKINCINAIENYGIENFERKTEIELPNDDENEPITVYVTFETFTEYSEVEKPDIPEVIERSCSCKIQLTNDGRDVDFKVLGERYFYEPKKVWSTKPAICIEEEIEKHFRV